MCFSKGTTKANLAKSCLAIMLSISKLIPKMCYRLMAQDFTTWRNSIRVCQWVVSSTCWIPALAFFWINPCTFSWILAELPFLYDSGWFSTSGDRNWLQSTPDKLGRSNPYEMLLPFRGGVVANVPWTPVRHVFCCKYVFFGWCQFVSVHIEEYGNICVYVHISRWWFQIFFIFTPIWGRFPIWLIFFRWVETTN